MATAVCEQNLESAVAKPFLDVALWTTGISPNKPGRELESQYPRAYPICPQHED